MSRSLPIITFAAIALAGPATSVARAQGNAAARIDLFGGAGTHAVDPEAARWLRQGSAGAAGAVLGSNGYVFGDLRVDGVSRDARLTSWSFDAGMTARSAGTWRLGWTATASAPDAPGTLPRWNARSIAAAHLGTTGVWAGVGPGSDGGGGVAGAWALLGSALFTATVETNRVGTLSREMREVTVHRVDTIPATDTSVERVIPVNWTRVDTSFAQMVQTKSALTMRADWAVGRWALSAWATRRAEASGVATSTTAMVTTRIANGVGLVADAGTSSRSIVGAPARYVSLGVRLWSPQLTRPAPAPVRPVARAFTVSAIGGGRYRLALRAPFARTVEVTGDFNGWSSTPLDEASPGVWEVTLRLSPGVHAINVRLNGGAWSVPPGVHTADDEFNGHVGMIVVP